MRRVVSVLIMSASAVTACVQSEPAAPDEQTDAALEDDGIKVGYVVTVDPGDGLYQQANVLILTRRGGDWVIARARESWHADLGRE